MDRDWVKASARRIHQVMFNLVDLELADAGEEGLEIVALWSEAERFRGHAGRAMRSLAELADRAGIELFLTPRWMAYDTEDCLGAEADELERLNAQRLDNEQLEAWYARMGFERTGEFDGDHPVMRRLPVPSPAYGQPCATGTHRP